MSRWYVPDRPITEDEDQPLFCDHCGQRVEGEELTTVGKIDCCIHCKDTIDIES